MEPILLQHLLNNWSDLSRREAQIVGRRTLNLPSATGEMLYPAPYEMAESSIAPANISNQPTQHKPTTRRFHLDIALRICPACDPGYGLYLLTVIVFEPSLLDKEHSRAIRHD